MTPAEAKKLAAKAKRERFENLFAIQLQGAGLPAYVRQYRFAQSLGRQWSSDFAWPTLKLLCEVDGGVWRQGGGAHSHPTNIVRDMEKQNDAALLGFLVLRFTTDQIKNGQALTFLARVMASRGTSSVPLRATA